MCRMGLVIGLTPEAIVEYKQIHKEVWRITDPMQVALATRKKGEWWAPMEEVFHHE